MSSHRTKTVEGRRSFVWKSSLWGAALVGAGVWGGRGLAAEEKALLTGELKDWKKIANRKGLAEGFTFLENPQLKSLADGRLAVRGEEIYAMVQHSDIRKPEESRYEAHRKYIDIQYLVEGAEEIRVAPVGKMKESVAYDAAKDIAFYEHPAAYRQVILKPGSFVVLFPEDAHMPLCPAGPVGKVHKVVVKIAVDALR